MIGLDNEIRLANILRLIATGEAIIEDSRQELATCGEFDPIMLFGKLDIGEKGFVSVNDVLHLLSLHNIRISRGDVEGFFRYFLGNNKSQISFKSFLNLIIPKSHLSNIDPKRLALSSNPLDNPGIEIRRVFVYMLEQEIVLHSELEKKKNVLLIKTGSNIMAMFSLLDPHELREIIPDRYRAIT